MSNKLSPTIIRLLIANMSYRSATIIIKIFLNIFILDLTGDIRTVAMFSIIVLSMHMLSYIIVTYIIQYWYRNIFHRLAMGATTCMLLALVIYPELIGTHYVVCGLLYGIGSGTYWCVYNMNQFDFTIPKNRGNYEGLKKSLRTTTSISIPFLIGLLIVADPLWMWYQFSFLIAAVFTLICWLFWYVDESKISVRKRRLQIWTYIKKIQKYPDLWKILVVSFLVSFALSPPLIEMLFPLILHTDGFNEAKIGIFISIASIVSIFVSYIFWKFISYNHYKATFITWILLYILGILWVIISGWQLWTYLFISFAVILYVIVDIPRSVISMNVLHQIDDYNLYKGEHILVSEIAIIAGRSITVLLLFFTGILNQDTIHLIFICMCWAMFIALIFFTLLTKNY